MLAAREQEIHRAATRTRGTASTRRAAILIVAAGTPQLLQRPTPCLGWDLETLLDHVSESIGVLHEVITAGGADASGAPGYPGPGPDPVARLRGHAARLLGACAAAGPADRRVAIWGPRAPVVR
jgi:Mycothiol maleylpyruvate isomerase N-terminal domain